MPYQLGDRTLALDVPWEHNSVQYPANWLRLSTAQDRAELGITWVDNSPTWNQKWYWGYDVDGNLKPKAYASLKALWIARNRRREGPPVVYTVMCGKTARPFTDHKAILKWVKWPKGTPTGDALREWLASFEQKPQAPAPELDMAKIKAEGFGPEAHDEDPTAHTKMVT